MSHLRKTTALLLAGMFASAATQADDYQFELSVTGDHASIDLDGASDLDAIGVGGTYYLKPVSTDGLPLAEAAFLDRSSYFHAAAVRSELGDEKIDIFGASFGYYIPNTMFYGRLGYTYADDFGDGDRSNLNGTFGITPMKGLLVTTDIDEDGWDPNATAKYVGKIADRNFYAASVSVTDPDDGDLDVGLAFDYYFDRTLSVGAGFNSGQDAFSVRAEKFFKPNFAVGGRVYVGDDTDGFGATVSWRF